jgi:nuclear pore complex protein Nup93
VDPEISRNHCVSFPQNFLEIFINVSLSHQTVSIDIEDPKPARRLNIARLVMLYVNKFEISDPAEALQYFYFLRNLRDQDGRNLFLVCVADLVIENRNYDLIFGKYLPNGVRSRGLIDQFDGINVNVQLACTTIADDLVKKGMFEDAIKMYDLGGNHEQALRYLIILLSQVVHQPNKRGSIKERLQQMALDLSDRYIGTEVICDGQIMKTFNIFKDLLVYFDLYHENKQELAIEILAKTKLVPLSMNDLEMCVQNFKK